MKITSSYGVELRKHNIPIRQTLDVYRSAVSYLTEIYEQVWKNWKVFKKLRNVSMKQNT